ncbi:hypothetical protein [Flavobacterium rhizosphaerae]|uniref:Long-chain fatty acid transport protein n=1 Tax=Flavobacterium rhizosphaerae TaxID=3163298 RepID=A0ABW8YS26_9FLAO
MIKKIIAGVCLLFSSIVFSQQNSASPYSYYGIGTVKTGTVDTRSMGGLGIFPDSIHLNLQNPASYSALRLTTFTVAGSNARTTLKSDEGSEKTSTATIDYIALALPFEKIAFSVGLMPYSSVGYRIENTTQPDPGDGLTRAHRFEGNGGINRVYAGVGYAISSKLRLGVDVQYNFGNIETKAITTVPDGQLQYYTREINSSDYSGFSFNIGAMYAAKFRDKYNWFTSATFSPQYNLNSDSSRQIATITLGSSGAEGVVDEVDINAINADTKMPMKFSLGTGIGQAQKWFAGLEYTYTGENELSSRFDNVTNAGYEVSHKVSLGGFYIPNYFSYTSYLSRVTYRAGIRYEKTGLVLNNEPINDYGLTLGLGLPLGGIGGSNLNIGAEFGKRGTTNAGLVVENYMNFFVSLSLNDKWFIKRKYD